MPSASHRRWLSALRALADQATVLRTNYVQRIMCMADGLVSVVVTTSVLQRFTVPACYRNFFHPEVVVPVRSGSTIVQRASGRPTSCVRTA